jgi:hypothetical protein
MTPPIRPSRARPGTGLTRGLLAVAALCCLTGVSQAKPARCFTSDDGEFGCEFRPTGRDGSFEISAPGKPILMLNMIEPGVAAAFANYGSRNVALPGRYLRATSEPGCWLNEATGTKLCAW